MLYDINYFIEEKYLKIIGIYIEDSVKDFVKDYLKVVKRRE